MRHLLRRGYRREAIVRVVVPLDPSRYLELPWALEQLGAKPGERVLDLAGPKLLSVVLARQGVRVTAVDQLEREIEAWRALAGDVPGLELRVADGRALPFEDASFDHACSISVLEHIEEPGDAEALRELARVVRPGGRVLVTLPHAQAYREDWRDAPVYANEPGSGRVVLPALVRPGARRRARRGWSRARARLARRRAHVAELERRVRAVVPVARAARAALRAARLARSPPPTATSCVSPSSGAEVAVDGVVGAGARVPREAGGVRQPSFHEPAVERAEDRGSHVLGRERVEVLGGVAADLRQ